MLAHHTVQKAEYWPNNWTVAGGGEGEAEKRERSGEREN